MYNRAIIGLNSLVSYSHRKLSILDTKIIKLVVS